MLPNGSKLTNGGKVDIVVHDLSGEYEEERAFLEGYLPRALNAITQEIGRPPHLPDSVHVVVWGREDHARRFPPKREQMEELEDDPLPPELDLPKAWMQYAHGIATRARAHHALPDGIPIGVPLICLDIETLTEISQGMDVDLIPTLAGTSTHEMSHIVRGHTEDRATHGYVQEGDAQRDTWGALHRLLSDPDYSAVASAARVTRDRMAARQPSAYRNFGNDGVDLRIQYPPSSRPLYWIVDTSAPALHLTTRGVVAVPIEMMAGTGSPPLRGDRVFLRTTTDAELLVGPWTVLQRSAAPDAASAYDLNRANPVRNESQRLVWLRMEADSEVLALPPNEDHKRNPDRNAAFRPTSIEEAEFGELLNESHRQGRAFIEEQANIIRDRDDAMFRGNIPEDRAGQMTRAEIYEHFGMTPLDPFEDRGY